MPLSMCLHARACRCVCGRTHSRPPRLSLHWPNSPVRHLKRQRASTNSTPSFSANLRGGVAFAGNTVETCPENQSAARHRVRRRRHSRATPQDSQACINANNNDHNMVYVNVDPSGGQHFDSSSATLTVPVGARVEKAFLYWAADLSEGVRRPQGTIDVVRIRRRTPRRRTGPPRRTRVARPLRQVPATTRSAIPSGERQICASARARSHRSMPPLLAAVAPGRESRAGTASPVTRRGSPTRCARTLPRR